MAESSCCHRKVRKLTTLTSENIYFPPGFPIGLTEPQQSELPHVRGEEKQNRLTPLVALSANVPAYDRKRYCNRVR